MKIAFVIHDIGKNGGQERSTLEIVNRCALKNKVIVLAASATGLHEKVDFCKIPVFVKRPVFIKDFAFRLFVTVKLLFLKPDLIHATGSCSFKADIVTVQFCQKRWVIERMKMKKKWGVRFLLELVQLYYDLWTENLVYKILRKKHYITLCEDDALDLKKFFGISDVTVIRHGVDLEEFRPDLKTYQIQRSSLGVKPEEAVILFVGTFERKGLFYLLPAFARLTKVYNLKLCVVGRGDFNRARRACADLEIEDLVIFAGQQSQMNKFYQASDIFILPSLYDPFGLVGIEALACGLPSIVSRHSGVRQFITSNENGFIINDPSSVEEIYNQLKNLLDLKSKFKDMGEKARQSVINQSWDNVWAKYEPIFENLKGLC